MTPHFELALRVYYEDTDAGGVVYYANYLRFLERARTEWLRALGVDQGKLASATGIAFAVRSLATEFLKPARLDDLIDVVSTIKELGRAQVVFHQVIRRGQETLLEATVRVACINVAKGKAVAMPKDIHNNLRALLT